MNLAQIFLPAALLLGCGTSPFETPDFTSSRGTKVYLADVADSGFTKLSVDEMEDFEVNRMVLKAGWGKDAVEAALKGGTLVLQPEPFTTLGELNDGGSAYITVSGVTNGDTMEVASVLECPFYTAFRHEQLHRLLGNLTGDQDGTHSRPEWEEVVSGFNYDEFFTCTELIGGWEARK